MDAAAAHHAAAHASVIRNKKMKLIMESWRVYSEQVERDSKFQLMIENINNAKDDETINAIVESWIEEQEQLLMELDIVAKGKAYIDEKVNDFLINLYMRAVKIIDSVVAAAKVVLGPVLKILRFIVNKIGGFFKRHPLIAKAASICLIALVMLCATALFNAAMAAGADPDVATMNKIIDVLQGIMADNLMNIESIEGVSQDYLSPGDMTPKLKAAYAESINHLESMKGKATDMKDLEQGSQKSQIIIKKTAKFLKELFADADKAGATLDRDDVNTAVSKWQKAGEAIEQAHYKYSEIKQVDAAGDVVSVQSRERLGMSGPGFKQ